MKLLKLIAARYHAHLNDASQTVRVKQKARIMLKVIKLIYNTYEIHVKAGSPRRWLAITYS